MTTPADELRAAAEKLRNLAKAIEVNHPPDLGWHVEECADDERGNCPCIVAQGTYSTGDGFVQPLFYVADAETPECAAYITAMDPNVGAALVRLLDQAADALTGTTVPDDEPALAVARAINA